MSRFPCVVVLACLCCAAMAVAEDHKIRTWFDVTGKHSMQASYVSHDANKVTLKDREGKIFEIELDQLSKTDRRFVELISKSQSDPADDGPPADSRPRVIGETAERGIALEVSPSDSGWSFSPRAESSLDFTPKEFKIPLEDFGESASHFVVTPSGRYGAITTRIPVRHTRVSIVDLSKKRVVATAAAQGEFLGVAISDDGQRVAVRADDFHNKKRIGVYRVSGKDLKPEGDFTPFPDRANSDIEWAGFVGDNQLAVLCKDEGISVWNLSGPGEDCYFPLEGDSAATRNYDGRVIAFVDKEKVGLFDVASQTFQAVQPVPSGLWTKRVAFSPSEQKLVSFAVNRIVVWDATTGTVVSDIPDINLPGRKVDCVQENYVLLDDKFLVDLDNQLKLWTYNGTHQTASAGGVTFFAIKRKAGRATVLAVVPVPLPDPEASRALEEALAKPDTFLVKPGGTVQLDISQVPEPHRAKVRQDLVARLQENRISVSDDAVSTLVASISRPQPVTAMYYSRKDRTPRSYAFSVLNSKIELIHDGKPVWSQQANNQPASVIVKDGESIQQELSRRTQDPNLGFFEHVRLPRLIQKQPKREEPGLLWTLGESTVR